MQIYLLQYLITDILICVTVAKSKNVLEIFIASFRPKTTTFLACSTLSELLFFFNGIHEPLLRCDISWGCPDRWLWRVSIFWCVSIWTCVVTVHRATNDFVIVICTSLDQSVRILMVVVVTKNLDASVITLCDWVSEKVITSFRHVVDVLVKYFLRFKEELFLACRRVDVGDTSLVWRVLVEVVLITFFLTLLASLRWALLAELLLIEPLLGYRWWWIASALWHIDLNLILLFINETVQ